MLANKHITKIIIGIMVLAVGICFCLVAFSDKIKESASDTGITMEYETELFDTSSIMTVDILMDEDDWNDMLENAISEEYYQCDVNINGTTFYQVAIRPKGNTSLSSIASDPDTDRYSFKLEFDYYVDGQTCFGLDKLVLNNNYADATNMKEALIYDMFQYLGADASLYNYAKISVNGEYWGVYLALEAVEDSFMLRNFGVSNGELYKPEGSNIAGGNDNDFEDTDFSNMSPPDNQNGNEQFDFKQMPNSSDGFQKPDDTTNESQSDVEESNDTKPDNNFDMQNMTGSGFTNFTSGSGANLNYIDDDLDSYSDIWDGEVTSSSKTDHKRVVTALKNISEGNDLEDYMDIDNLLRYMAVHIFAVNEDSLSGSMAHNYYLYEYDGKLNLIPWDYNLSFGGMGSGSDATSVVNSPIDDAFSSTTFFDTLMEDETYHNQYYAYLEELVSEYIEGGGFDEFYNRVRSQIDELVESDPTAFYSYEEYLEAVDTLYQVVKLRGESIEGQINGTIASTESSQRDSDTLIDASSLDISLMGYMNNGGGNNSSFDKPTSFDNNNEEKMGSNQPPTNDNAESDENNNQETNEGSLNKEDDNTIGEDKQSQSFDSRPNDFPSSQFNRDDSNSTQAPDMPSGNDFDGNMSFDGSNSTSSISTNNLIIYGISIIIFVSAMIFVLLYHRRSR